MVNLTALKFKDDGSFRPFAGNTVVANLADQLDLVQLVSSLQEVYRELPCCPKLTLLPLSSLHMTVMELLCDQNRHPAFWSKFLPLDLPITAVHAYFGEQLSHFPLTQESIRMRVVGLGLENLQLEPADEASRRRLEAIRQYISYKTGVIFPNHHRYRFHISIAYLREPLTPDEEAVASERLASLSADWLTPAPEVRISRIDYTTFEDMSAFVSYQKD